MLREPTLEKLYELRLPVMATSWQEQERDDKLRSLDFDERFGLLVEAEHRARDNRRLQRLLKQAELRLPDACMEDLEPGAARGLPATTTRQLATGAWLGERLNVLVSGATGVGKSYLACALGQMACRQSHTVLYRRMPRLFEELRLARAEGSFARKLAKMAKMDLLILDDFGLGHLDERQRHDLLEVFEDRYGKHSTVVTSQLPIAKWHEWIGDKTLADAILDRLIHNAYKVQLKGHSRRERKTNP
jgi:DNA replication protein DnaC